MEWISVNDRLPELKDGNVYSEDVFAYCISDGETRDCRIPNTYPKAQRYSSIDCIVRWKDSSPSFRCNKMYGKVTHWMPLPEPPKE